MAGLLDFLSTPAGQGLLTAGLGAAASAGRGRGLLGNLSQGGLMGVQAYAGAQDRQTAEQYKDLQMKALTETIATNRRKNELVNGILGQMGGGVQPAPMEQVSQALTDGAAAGSIGPTVANAARLPQQRANGGGLMASLTPDMLARLQLAGVGDLTNVYKLARPDWQVSGGYAFDKNDPRFQGGFLPQANISQSGQASVMRPDGKGGLTVSAPEGAVDTYRSYKQADADVATGSELVKVVGADGAERYLPKSAVLGATQTRPAAMPSPSAAARSPASARAPYPVNDDMRLPILQQELASARAQGRTGDVAALEREIARLPASTAAASGGGFQATPTTAQAAEAARVKAQAETEGRGAGQQTADRNERATKASEMVENLTRARTLLSMNPTESAVGAFADRVFGAAGISTNSSQSAAALETLSGWLVNNVPRMQGPQSNFDVSNYTTMAGKIGDRQVPIKDRLAALEEVERIQRKYAHLNGGDQSPAADPPKPRNVVQQLPKTAPKGTRARDLERGGFLVFDGMRWKPEGN